ncbi:MAG: tetratricopeptide repeat protein [Oscillospiraceae bacterium]|nr:tetratricopeptide repeat protein [Oscillospiraceae bacterium]
MHNDSHVLQPEDYVEPNCVLCGEPYGAEPKARPVPQQRIIEKMDEYMSRRDYAGAERHLLYWLAEAKLGGDKRGELLLRNELVGHYRKVGDRDKALANGDEALALLDELDFGGTISSGTTCTNVATACNAFGENDRALALFEKARAVYESSPRTQPQLLGGLYNNMALTCASLGRYNEAFSLYDKAMDAMGKVPGGVLEQAITCLNMANAVEARDGMEAGEHQIFDLVDRAWDLLNDPAAPRDGYYAFVCEKCAPTFSYYGYFAAAEELNERAKKLYERT